MKLRICYECGLAFEGDEGQARLCNCPPAAELEYDKPLDPCAILLVLTLGAGLLLAGLCLGILSTDS